MTATQRMNSDFWRGKRVFVTGHTGFKGAWLCTWLEHMGAQVTGFALDPPTTPNLFTLVSLSGRMKSVLGDVRNLPDLKSAMLQAAPEIVFHMAAQPLVRDSYKIPVETYSTNVMGTVHLLESVRHCDSVRAVVNVTTDKCYENREWHWGYRENEPMGGYDPYSSSKGCSELVTSAYRSSFFPTEAYSEHNVAIASARAGNVVGGGDWAVDRLVPDILRALMNGEPVRIRNPHAIRPWQHVLEPLSGYLLLAERLYAEGPRFAEGWNFGPGEEDARPVEWIVQRFCEAWGEGATYSVDDGNHPHEARYLKLDCSKAKNLLGWVPRWDLEQAVRSIVLWNKEYLRSENVYRLCLAQIDEYTNSQGVKRVSGK